MPKDPDAMLKIYGHGGHPVETATEMLTALNHAYSSIWLYGSIETKLEQNFRRWKEYEPFLFRPFSYVDPAAIAPMIESLPAGCRLRLSGVTLQSPGFWEFLGKINPLEILRLAINDNHERRKDREYREDAEKRRLELENLMLENQLVRERIATLQDMGATETELAQLRARLIHEPIDNFLTSQDRGLIEHAELVEVNEDGDGGLAA